MTTISAIAHFGTGLGRFGLTGCLLNAGLLTGFVHPGSAGEGAPAHVATPVSQVQGAGQPDSGTAPAPDRSAPDTARPISGIGFGWG